MGKTKKQVFDIVQDRVWKKLKGWEKKCLSKVGKEVLIKSIAQSIPTFIMDCFLLPKSLWQHIEALINRFYWGSRDGERKIHWVRWYKLCEPKQDGGLGFRNFEAFNLSLQAKQG